MKNLENEIIELEGLSEITGSEIYMDNLKLKKNVLANLLGMTAQRAQVRSHFQDAEFMDAPSIYFPIWKRKNGQKGIIHALASEDGTLLVDHSKIHESS